MLRVAGVSVSLALGRGQVTKRGGSECHEVGHSIDRLGIDLLDEGDELADRTHRAGSRRASAAGALVSPGPAGLCVLAAFGVPGVPGVPGVVGVPGVPKVIGTPGVVGVVGTLGMVGSTPTSLGEQVHEQGRLLLHRARWRHLGATTGTRVCRGLARVVVGRHVGQASTRFFSSLRAVSTMTFSALRLSSPIMGIFTSTDSR